MAAALAGGAALLASPGAFAHGRGPAVALDYRFRLATAPAGVQLRVLDGDRSLEARVGPSTSLLVRGYLREPMLPFDARGVFANAASPTAQADRLTRRAPAGSGWRAAVRTLGTTTGWRRRASAGASSSTSTSTAGRR